MYMLTDVFYSLSLVKAGGAASGIHPLVCIDKAILSVGSASGGVILTTLIFSYVASACEFRESCHEFYCLVYAFSLDSVCQHSKFIYFKIWCVNGNKSDRFPLGKWAHAFYPFKQTQ